MAKVSVETVDLVARLAHLSLTEEERTTFARQLEQILSYAESIQALDTKDVEPMSHATSVTAFREDAEGPCIPRETALEEAPDAQDGLYRVPRVIQG
jgi:aspartyl-tRNA(Asn)/glutamyl-tRNA(Gln) amidotransferase subunit C